MRRVRHARLRVSGPDMQSDNIAERGRKMTARESAYCPSVSFPRKGRAERDSGYFRRNLRIFCRNPCRNHADPAMNPWGNCRSAVRAARHAYWECQASARPTKLNLISPCGYTAESVL